MLTCSVDLFNLKSAIFEFCTFVSWLWIIWFTMYSLLVYTPYKLRYSFTFCKQSTRTTAKLIMFAGPCCYSGTRVSLVQGHSRAISFDAWRSSACHEGANGHWSIDAQWYWCKSMGCILPQWNFKDNGSKCTLQWWRNEGTLISKLLNYFIWQSWMDLLFYYLWFSFL